MKRFSVVIALTCLLQIINDAGYGQGRYEAFANGFKNPPASAQPIVYYWWLGGNVDNDVLKTEIAEMKKSGIAGFTIFEIGTRDTAYVKSGPEFLEKESLNSIRIAVEEAGKLGMHVGLNTASSWNAGGKWITPEHAAKSIYYSSVMATNGASDIKIPFPEIPELDPWGKPRRIKYRHDGKPVFYKEIVILAAPRKANVPLDTSKVVNVSDYFDPETETLRWKKPDGDWEIFRFVCSNSGENLVLPSEHSAGPIVDHYDPEATEFHFMYIINKLKSVLGEDLSKTALKSLYMASYEAKGFTWTVTLPEVFRKINGYDVYKFLPILFRKDFYDRKTSARFTADFQRTLSELMINNFYKKSKEICNRHGLKNNSEAGGPGLPLHNVPVEPIKALGSLDIPRGEFWINHNRLNEKGIDILRVVKEVSAASNISGRRIVEMEAFTTFQHWQEGPFEMKPSGDQAFCEGMNKVVVHGFSHNPSGTGHPGIAYLAGTHFNNKRVWWPKVKPFNEYLSRVSYVLQEADFVADVLYYYGDTIPNYGGHKNSRFMVGAGFDYEIVNTEKLLELTVADKKLVLPTGAQFTILALPEESEIDAAVLSKLNELVGKGAIVTGLKPRALKGRTNDASLIEKLWGKTEKQTLQTTGGKIYGATEPVQILQAMNVVPDFSYPGHEMRALDYIHYAKKDLDFYFIRNTTGEWISKTCSFRQPKKVPEVFDPVSGEINPVSVYKSTKNQISLPITLAPFGSLFIVFKPGQPNARFTTIGSNPDPPQLSYSNHGTLIWENGILRANEENKEVTIENHIRKQPIDGAWEVFFPEGWGAPERIIFPELVSWTKFPDKGVQYFSGTATYKKTFQYTINSTIMEGHRIFLDLGDLSNVGEVWLNNKPLGVAWTKPYRFDVTDVIRPGDNLLVVEIANVWSNRLAGDAKTGEQYTNTNITATNIKGLNKISVPWKDVPLIDAGLFGPVNLITIKPVK